jgi:hypothetical protein
MQRFESRRPSQISDLAECSGKRGPEGGHLREREGPRSSWLASRSSVDPADPLGVVLKRRAEQEPTKNDKRWRPSDHHSKQKCLKCCHCALLGTPGFAANWGQAGESPLGHPFNAGS